MVAPKGAVDLVNLLYLVFLALASLLSALGLGRRLLGQENSLDVGQHTALSDGNTSQQLVQLLVIPDGQLKMTRDDSALLVVSGSIPSQLQDLSRQVLEHGRHVNRSSSTNSLGVVSFSQKTVDSSNWELQTCSG